MPRLRTLKYEFFANDLLAECQPLARLLFAGLWTIADREGRLEDRPKRIKAAVLPYDECDVHALLDELAGHDFIVRYSIDGVGYIAIPKWSRHQNPHVKEAVSIIPAPPHAYPDSVHKQCENDACTMQEQDHPGSSCHGSGSGSGHDYARSAPIDPSICSVEHLLEKLDFDGRLRRKVSDEVARSLAAAVCQRSAAVSAGATCIARQAECEGALYEVGRKVSDYITKQRVPEDKRDAYVRRVITEGVGEPSTSLLGGAKEEQVDRLGRLRLLQRPPSHPTL